MQEQKKQSDSRTTSTRKNIRFDNELLALIDSDLNGAAFSAWVQDACNEKLQGNNKVTGK